MALLKGKQISDIRQRNMSILTDTIQLKTSTTNKDFTDTDINKHIKFIHQSFFNKNMVANNAIKGEIACNYGVAEQPLSTIIVKINNVMVNVGASEDCYFSPDGVIIRGTNDIQKGDILYWNSSTYDLESDDSIDFEYLSYFQNETLNSGEIVELDTIVNALSVRYVGASGTSMTVIIDDISFNVKNVNNTLVWDADGLSYTLSTKNDSHVFMVNGNPYTIYFDGFGSLLFSIRQGDKPTTSNFLSAYGNVRGFIASADIDSDGNVYLAGRIKGFDYNPIGYFYEMDDNFNVITENIPNKFNYVVYVSKETSDGKYLVGGGFSQYSGITANNIIKLNQDYTIDTTFAYGTGFNSEVYQLIENNGKYLIGGLFTTYQGVASNYIIRLNSNGTKDTSFSIGTGFNSAVYDVKIDSNDKYVISGLFTTYSGATANRIIRLNQNGTKDTSFNIGTGFNGGIYSIYVQTDNKIVVGGQFTTYSGITANYIIRLNQDGTIDNTFNTGTGFGSGGFGYVYCIKYHNDKLYVSGWFKSYNGVTCNGLIRLNMDGTVDPTFKISQNVLDNNVPYVFNVSIVNNNIFVTSAYMKKYFDNDVCNFLVLNMDGSIKNSSLALIDPIIFSTSDIIYKNNKYVCFSTIAGYNYNSNTFNFGSLFLSRNSSYSSLNRAQPNMLSLVTSIKCLNDGRLLYYYNNRIEIYSRNGIRDTSFVNGGINTTTSNGIYDQLAYKNNDIYVGGRFTTYSGITANRIVKLTLTGAMNSGFSSGTGFNNYTHTLFIQDDDKLLVGGVFTTYSGITANRIIRLNSNGSIDSTFVYGTGFNNTIYKVRVRDNKIYCCGDFTTYNGSSVNRFIRLNMNGTIDNTFNIGTGFNNSVQSFDFLSNGDIVLSGSFTTYKGVTANRIVKIDVNGNIDQLFLTNIGTGFEEYSYSLVIFNDTIAVSNRYSVFNDKKYHTIKYPVYYDNTFTTIFLKANGEVEDRLSKPVLY